MSQSPSKSWVSVSLTPTQLTLEDNVRGWFVTVVTSRNQRIKPLDRFNLCVNLSQLCWLCSRVDKWLMRLKMGSLSQISQGCAVLSLWVNEFKSPGTTESEVFLLILQYYAPIFCFLGHKASKITKKQVAKECFRQSPCLWDGALQGGVLTTCKFFLFYWRLLERPFLFYRSSNLYWLLEYANAGIIRNFWFCIQSLLESMPKLSFGIE